MRISGNSNVDVVSVPKTFTNDVSNSAVTVNLGSSNTVSASDSLLNQTQKLDNSEETKVKVQQAVNTLNDFLTTTDNSSKFMYHEGLNRYYVTVVDRETEEVIREIPPKNLLDAFYQMQKLLGIIVDEKI